MAKYTRKKSRPLLLKTGKGLAKIPMAGLKSLESAGKHFQKTTGSVNKELKNIRKEIRARVRR